MEISLSSEMSWAKDLYLVGKSLMIWNEGDCWSLCGPSAELLYIGIEIQEYKNTFRYTLFDLIFKNTICFLQLRIGICLK